MNVLSNSSFSFTTAALVLLLISRQCAAADAYLRKNAYRVNQVLYLQNQASEDGINIPIERIPNVKYAANDHRRTTSFWTSIMSEFLPCCNMII